MVRRPPHIVVTTPESLFILLTADRSRRMLSTAETVIVDEIHALIDDKRGSHLGLSLARLDDLVVKSGGARPQRIGLSATVKPIGEVARFLGGTADARAGRSVRARRTTRGPSLRRGACSTVATAGSGTEDDARGEAGRGAGCGFVQRFRRRRASGDDCRLRSPPRARPRRGGAAGGARRRRHERDVGRDLRSHRRSRPRPPDHHRLRQHPASVRAGRAPPRGAARRGGGAGPSRQPVAAASPGGGSGAQGGPAARGRRHRVARAGDRRGSGRSGVPDRHAAVDRGGAAADRPIGSQGGSVVRAEGPVLRNDA